MPELPEVETIVRGLARAVVGKRIRRAEIRLPNSGSLVIELRRGGALTDLKVELIPEGKAPLRLLTHRSRRLEAVLSPHVPR